MFKVLSICGLNNLPDIRNDYFARFPNGQQPDHVAEFVEHNGERFWQLKNDNGILACYTTDGKYIEPDVSDQQ